MWSKPKLTSVALYLFYLFLAVHPFLADAQIGGIPLVPVADPGRSLFNIINTIIRFAFGLLLTIAALFIMYAAYLYLSSGGSEDAIRKAKNYIFYAVVAIIVAFLARLIPFIVERILGVPSRGGGFI